MQMCSMPIAVRISLLLIFFAFSAGPVRAQSAAERLYKAKCVACHGADGKGDTPVGKKLGARDLHSSEVQNQSDAQLIEVLTKGKNKMPAYGKTLKDDEIKDLIAYVRELARKK